MARKIFVFLILIPILLAAQTEQKKDVWEPLRFLEGAWEGEDPGVSKVTQVYQFVLNGIFLTEHVENAPEGTKAKLEFKVLDEDEIEQSFHVAFPGREFSCFFTHHLKKRE